MIATTSSKLIIAAQAIAMAQAASYERVTGLVAPTFAPLDANGSVNLDAIDAYASYLNRTGVRWIYSSGTTGESVDLTVDERKAIAEKWIQVAPKYGQKVIVHVGADSVIDAQDMAKHAEENKAWGIAAMPPTFITPKSLKSLATTMGTIAGAAPSLPFYYYHIPSMTNVDVSIHDWLLEQNIPNLAGVKFTHWDLMDLQLAMRVDGGKYNFLFGRDEYLMAAAAFGVEGAVGSTYNFNGELMNTVLDSFKEAGTAGVSKQQLETAQSAQFACAELIKEIQNWSAQRSGDLDGFKILMTAMTGVNVGPARLPYLPPQAADVQALTALAGKWCDGLDARLRPSWCKNAQQKQL